MQEIDPALRVEDFTYDLPDGAIAQIPVEPRDSSRLLDTRDGSDRVFSELPKLLEPGDLVVVNRTRVRPARLTGTRVDTGGSIELLLLGPSGDGGWVALAKPSRRLRPGIELEFDEGVIGTISSDPEDGRVRIRFRGTEDEEGWVGRIGAVPLPPYIRAELEDDERYQTIFAEVVGSAAAPTAALHFTDAVVDGLRDRGIEMTQVELEVGLGTFRPVTTDRLIDHVMHSERFRVGGPAVAAIAACRERGGRVVAVGTTVMRTLESVATTGGLIEADEGATDLFITPGYRFRVVDLLLTNFHVPGSTLVALVAAALGESWRDHYESALHRGYRFLSFGDAMLCEVPRRR